MISMFAGALRTGLAALFIFLFVSAPAFSGVTVIVSKGLASSQGGISTFECTDVCTLPTSGALPIPFPEISASIDNGQLRGRASIFGNGSEKVGLTGAISKDVMGKATFNSFSSTVLVGGIPVSALLAASMQNGSIRATTRFHVNSSASATFEDCPHDEACDGSGANARASVFMNSGPDGIYGDGGGGEETFAGTGLNQPTASTDFTETASLSVPFSEDFQIGWSFEMGLNATPNGSASLDFSSTLGFTSLGFYDANGVDVTRFFDVTFADGTVIPSPVAAIPEPETYAMLLAGLGVLGFLGRRRKIRAADRVTL